MGQHITEYILLRASVFDALIISVILLLFIYVDYFKRRKWMIIFIGILISVVIELFAMKTSRWGYNDLMPIIPYLQIGLTPTIQLGLLGYISFYIVRLSID